MTVEFTSDVRCPFCGGVIQDVQGTIVPSPFDLDGGRFVVDLPDLGERITSHECQS